MKIIFVKTRWFYQSYTDFWHLVELSEFPTCFVDEMDINDPEAVYIVAPMNGEWRPFIDQQYLPNLQRKAKLILWNLERPGGSGTLQQYSNDNLALIGEYVDKVVVSDRSLAFHCSLDYLTLGGHPDLGIPGSLSVKKYDVIHLSCYSNHRSWLFDAPDRPKSILDGNITVARNGWGQDRHWSLQESRYMLNVHQDGFPFIEPLRFVLAAMYGLPIISEACNNFYPYKDYVIPIDGLKAGVLKYGSDNYMDGKLLRNNMIHNFPFRKCVEAYARLL